MIPLSPSLFEQLELFVAGECSATESAVVLHWLSETPEHAAILENIREIRRVVASSPAFDVRALLQKTLSAIEHADAEHERVANEQVVAQSQKLRSITQRSFGRFLTPRSGHRRIVWSVVGGFALCMIAFSMGWRDGVSHFHLPTPTAVSTYVTDDGQRANITLTDGTTVSLNVASRLEVPADYAQGNHTLRLTGEALFTVMHHPGAPLTVVAGPSQTRVLGTSFVVRYYKTDTVATIAVRDGKVAVDGSRDIAQSTVLTAMRQIDIDAHGVTHVGVASPGRFSFAMGVLTLDGIRLQDAIPELNRWYNTDIRIGSPALATREIVGKLPSGSVNDLVELLEGSFDVAVVRDGKMLTLYTRG